MRRREARDEAAKISLSDPFRQTALQHALPAAADASDDDYGAISTRLSRAQKARKRGATCLLSMPMQIEFAPDLELAAPHAFLIAPILRKRRGLWPQSGCSGLWRRRDNTPVHTGVVEFVRFGWQLTTRLYARGDAAPQLLFICREIALLLAHAA